jgi:hypothetical protein
VDCRQGRRDAAVVSDLAIAVERDVEIDPQEHALAVDFYVPN